MAFDVHTHSIVIRNSGALSAHNVRIQHALSVSAATVNVSVDPPGVNFTHSILPSGGDEFLFPILVAGQQITISYLYYPPLTWDRINLQITCDEGMARVLHVLPIPQLSPWRLWLLRALVVIGAIATIFVVVQLGRLAVDALPKMAHGYR